MRSKRHNHLRGRSEHRQLLLLLFGIVAFALCLAAAGGGVDQNATAQDVQYAPAPDDPAPAPAPDDPAPAPAPDVPAPDDPAPAPAIGSDPGSDIGPGSGPGKNDTCDQSLSTNTGDQIDPMFEAFTEEANITFNAPEEMQLGEDRTIQLLLSPSASFEELTEELTEPGEILCATIVSGAITQARLTSPDFEISPVTPETQSTVSVDTSHWEWDIEPKEAGKDQKLHLVLSVFVTDPEHPVKSKPQTMEVLNHTMTVNVSFEQRVAKFFNLGETPFISLFGTFLGGGAVVALVGYIATRRSRSNPSPPEGRRQA